VMVRQKISVVHTWKKDASTPRKQRMLKIRPMTFTSVTGVNFFAVLKSSLGISIFFENNAETWRRTTAKTSWFKRKSIGSSGVEFMTALFLERCFSNVGLLRSGSLTRIPSTLVMSASFLAMQRL
jgi:hypothetical protein